jgi:hypothetical protein
MSSDGYTEGVNEWGERTFTCTECPTLYWFLADIQDHVMRHRRADGSMPPAPATMSDAVPTLASRMDKAAEEMAALRKQMDDIAARLASQDAIAAARAEGRNQALYTVANALAENGMHDAANLVRELRRDTN